MSEYTSGPWHPGCIVNDDSSCNCTSILDEGYAGGIATIHVHNEIESISHGGNDAPPIEVAKANSRLIAIAPETYELMLEIKKFLYANPSIEAQKLIEEIDHIDDLVEGRKKFT